MEQRRLQSVRIETVKTESSEPRDLTVLVLNASQEMAKEMTMQLALAIPGCSIMYAPSLELAKWMLRRRTIHLIIASMLLPDGPVSRLSATLTELPKPPDLVVVGPSHRGQVVFPAPSHALTTSKTLHPRAVRRSPPVAEAVGRPTAAISADLRNDLNNPLQEIVAMVYVARANGASSPVAEQALHAIDQAAKNLAIVVKGIEHKLERAFGG